MKNQKYFNYANVDILVAFNAFQDETVRTATKYVSEDTVVSISRRHKPHGRGKMAEFCMKLGAPNFLQRRFIRACKRAGEPFPVKKVQLKYWPKK